MKYIFLCFMLSHQIFSPKLNAQIDIIIETPPLKLSAEEDSYILDSINMHLNSDKLYEPHRCQNRHGYYGFVGQNHKTIIPFEYLDIESSHYLKPFNIVRNKNKLRGAVDHNGNIIVPIENFSLQTLVSDSLYILIPKINEPPIVIDRNGKTLIGPYMSRIWMMDNKTIAALPMNIPIHETEIHLYDLNGKLIKKLPYSDIIKLEDGRYMVNKTNSNLVTFSGILSDAFQILVPLDYNTIIWLEGDWAFVINHKKKQRGLYQISTQTFTQLDYYHIGHVNKAGTFIIGVGEKHDEIKYGLMNTKWKEVLPAKFLLNPIEGSNSFLIHSKKGKYGIVNSLGEIVLDTIYYGLRRSLYTEKYTHQNHKGQWFIKRDTMPYLLFEDPNKGWGIWHKEKGILEQALYQSIHMVDEHSYIIEYKDSCRWKNTDGDLLLGNTFRIRKESDNPFILVQPNWNQIYKWYHLNGTFFMDLPNEPRYVINDLFCIPKFDEKQNPKTKYALMNTKGQILTDYVFEEPLLQMRDLHGKSKAAFVKEAINNGKGEWIAWSIDKSQTKIQLVDVTGNIKTLSL